MLVQLLGSTASIPFWFTKNVMTQASMRIHAFNVLTFNGIPEIINKEKLFHNKKIYKRNINKKINTLQKNNRNWLCCNCLVNLGHINFIHILICDFLILYLVVIIEDIINTFDKMALENNSQSPAEARNVNYEFLKLIIDSSI